MDPVLADIVDAFAEFEFSNQIADKYAPEYEEQLLSEHNVIERLAEIEEYVNTLIQAVAYKRNQGNPQLSTIPVDVLPSKDFDRGEDKLNLIDQVTMDEGDFDQPFTKEEIRAKAESYVQRLAEADN